MKMKTSVVASVVAMAMFSLGAHAATPLANTHGQGTVNFKGTVVDAPCGIAQESADQTVDFGQISKAHLDNDGISVKKDLDIKLVNCEIDPATPKKVSITFSGTTQNGVTQELGTTGNTHTAIVVSSPDQTLVTFDGATKSEETALKAGDNTLKYSAWVKKANAATSVTEGAFTAVANFNLSYQ